MNFLSPARRARRSGEWTPATAVTFIVTLAASRCVTLAAREAGMSRKSAYALKSRDRAFCDAWQSALNAPRSGRQSGKVEEVEASLVSVSQGDNACAAALTSSSTGQRRDRRQEEAARDLFFARLAARLPVSPPAAADLLPSRKSLSH